jgi:hypothetical protein
MAEEHPMTVPGCYTVELGGSLTSDGSGRLGDALSRLPAGGELLVRFRGTAEVQPVVLALLAGHLRGYRGSASIRLQGLRERDCRLLRYLGLLVDPNGTVLTTLVREEATVATA